MFPDLWTIKLCVAPDDDNKLGVAITVNGLKCAGLRKACTSYIPLNFDNTSFQDPNGGVLAPALASFGPNLGLEEIRAEASTRDGLVLDALGGPASPPNIIGGDNPPIRATDGLVFASRQAK